MMSSIRRQKGPYVNSVHYDESQTSRISSIYYELPEETSETEADMYDYSTSAPVDYEEPDNTSDTLPPEIPEREQHIAKPPTHPPPILHQGESDNEDEQDDIYDNNNTSTRCKLYTTLTHVHMPSIYSTPSHSMEFRTNTAVSDSMLDLNSEATITTPPPAVTHPDQNSHTLSANWNVKSSHRCRTKMVILMFLLVAVAIGMISLIVSVVAVFVTSRTTESTDSLNLTDMMELQEQVQLLQTEVEIMRNRTTGSVDISSFYDGCEKETKSNRCNPEEGFGIEFSCITECLDLEKMVCTNNTRHHYHF